MADMLIWLIAVLGAASGIALGRIWGRAGGKRAGKKEAERDAMTKTGERVERGRDALRDGRDNTDPAERLRRNDSKW